LLFGFEAALTPALSREERDGINYRKIFMIILVVVRSFGPYRVGDLVRDAAEVERVLASEHAGHVVRIEPAQEV